MNRKISAFTLIEILVALTIIGVLLTFVAPYVFDRPDQVAWTQYSASRLTERTPTPRRAAGIN